MDNQNKVSEVIVVEASAGSGKTLALAKRYIKLLMVDGCNLQNILAITFTNKATIEMKERILELLKRIALDVFSKNQQKEDIFSYLNIDEKIARQKALYILDNIIKNYNFFNIQTIDSFINAILSASSFNINRSSNFKIKTDSSDLIAYSFDTLVEEAAKNKDLYKLLEEFLVHYLFVENNTSWFPKKDILELLKGFFLIVNKFGLSFYVFDIKTEELLKRKKEVFRKIERIVKKIPEGFNQNKINSIKNFLEDNQPFFNIQDIPIVFASQKPPLNKNKTASEGFIKLWETVSNELTQILELESLVIYNPYIKLFENIFEIFEKISMKEDIIFLDELNRKASLLFDEHKITVPELYYRLACRFSHYLIDEFQDTSILQWENLKIMIEEALSTGGSLFYVGDKKQAIYRFRGGDARLFDRVREEFKHFNVKKEHLIKNWRSHKTIVEFNNSIFSKENLKNMLLKSEVSFFSDNDLDEILSVFEDARQTYNPSYSAGYVYVERIFEKNQAERNQIMEKKVLELIKSLSERFEYEDIAILARDNDEVELITGWLLNSGIPVISDKTLNVAENPLIKEIIAFLKFLYSPPDDLSFASFILGKIFSRATGLQETQIADFIFTLNKENQLGSSSLYRFFREKFPKIWQDYIEEFFKNVGYLSVYELVINIYRTFKVYENFYENFGFFMKFLELIKSKEEEYTGLGQFLEYLEKAKVEDLYVNVMHGSGIKVLTIHKSKGLEFGVVIIPFFRMEINPSIFLGKGSYKKGSYIIKENDKLKLLRITKIHRVFSEKLRRIYQKAYIDSYIDELNTLYVALTRAKYELYIFIPQKSGVSKNNALYLISEDFVESGEKINYPKEVKDQQPLLNIPPLKYESWTNLIKEEFPKTEDLKNREDILEGILLHTILSKIKNCIGINLDEALKDAIRFVKTQFIFLKDADLYKEKIKKILESNILKSIFYIEKGDVFCEKEIVDKDGNLKRIDRLIVKDNEVLIVDYKSSSEFKENHYLQVKEYMQILKDIYPEKTIRGFILYLDEVKLEEVI